MTLPLAALATAATSGIAIAAFAFGGISVAATGGQQTCTGYEHKVDGLSGHTYTITPEPGEVVTGWCVKFSTSLRYGSGVLVDISDQKHEISHVAWNDAATEPTEDPTPTDDPTVDPTPTDDPDPTTDPTPTDEPTDDPTTDAPEPTQPAEPEPSHGVLPEFDHPNADTGTATSTEIVHRYTCTSHIATTWELIDGERTRVLDRDVDRYPNGCGGGGAAAGEFNPSEEGK